MVKDLNKIEELLKNQEFNIVTKDEDINSIFDNYSQVRSYVKKEPNHISIEGMINIRKCMIDYRDISRKDLSKVNTLMGRYKKLGYEIDKSNRVTYKKKIIEPFWTKVWNNPAVKAIKRAYNRAKDAFARIKKMVSKVLKKLKEIKDWLVKTLKKIAKAIFKAAFEIKWAIEKLREYTKTLKKKNKEILETSKKAVINATKIAKIISDGTALRVKYILEKARGRDSRPEFSELDKIDYSIKLMKKYNSSKLRNMVRSGIKEADQVTKDKDEIKSSKVNINTKQDLGTNLDFKLGNEKLERFQNVICNSKLNKLNTFLFILLVIFIIYILRKNIQ